jgi:hypothetical protein
MKGKYVNENKVKDHPLSALTTLNPSNKENNQYAMVEANPTKIPWSFRRDHLKPKAFITRNSFKKNAAERMHETVIVRPQKTDNLVSHENGAP